MKTVVYFVIIFYGIDFTDRKFGVGHIIHVIDIEYCMRHYTNYNIIRENIRGF